MGNGTVLAMNKLVFRKIVFAASVILVVLASFWFGGYIASNRTTKSIYGVQANLAFGHLKAYEEIYSYLNSDCKTQAIVRLEFLIDRQKMLMAEYIQATDDREFEKYVSLRNPELIEELHHYHINWDKKLTITECAEGDGKKIKESENLK